METLEKVDEIANRTTRNPFRKEGKVAKIIEKQTAKLPSDVFLWASLGSMTASLTLKIMKQNSASLFVGQWAPSFLLFGIYNKIVKVQGSEKPLGQV